MENEIDGAAVARAVCDPASLYSWQRYVLSCFPREKYVDVPAYARYMSSMWRHATWESFVSDTVAHNGTQMAALLSLAYKPKVIVEFGLDAGFTTLQLCRLNPFARVYGVDKYSKKRDADVPICFHALMNGVDNLTLHIGNSWEFKLPHVGLCFIDGEHVGDAPYLDSIRAWENRDVDGDWCIAWDDYHENNPDVKRAVDRFCSDVGMPLHQVGSWFYIGTKDHKELARWM